MKITKLALNNEGKCRDSIYISHEHLHPEDVIPPDLLGRLSISVGHPFSLEEVEKCRDLAQGLLDSLQQEESKGQQLKLLVGLALLYTGAKLPKDSDDEGL